MHGWRTRLTALATLALVAAITPAASGAPPELARPVPIDWEAPVVVDRDPGYATQGLFDDDPTGLVPKTPFVQRYSLDQDYWEVWLCGSVSASMSSIIATLNAASVDYFDSISGGVYEPVFSAGGSITTDGNGDCLPEFLDGTYPTAGSQEGVLIVDHDYGSGGYASPGWTCINTQPDCTGIGSTFPSNRRYVVLGEAVLPYASIINHEIGHTLQWPHSNSGLGGEYDNPIDLMSGNRREGGGTESDPYDTLSYSRFQSGWVSNSDVAIADGSYQAVTLQPHNVSGTQLLAIKTAQAGRFYVFGARTTSTYDPIPSAWQGVEVYEVDYYCGDQDFIDYSNGICPGIYRDQTQQPPSPNGVGHVLGVGESVVLEGLTVTVTGTTATGYTLTVDPDPGTDTEPTAPGTPTAVPGDEQASISWTAAADGGSPILNYDLEVDEVGGGSTVNDVGVTLETTATGLSNGTTYRARVRATNAIGDGPWSSWSSDFVPGAVPAAPGSPEVSAGDASISAGWVAPGDDGGFPITNYELQLNDQTAATNTYLDAGTSLTAEVDDLVNGHTYRLRVRAENARGSGPWSPWSDGVVPVTVPSAPLEPTITVTAVDAATASWAPPADDGGLPITGYELTLENRTGGGSVNHDPGTATTHGLTGLTTGDTYRYRVRAENSEGWSAWSAWSPDFIPGTVPSAPGVPDVVAGDAEITASWTAASGLGSAVDAYEVELENEGAVTVGAVLMHTFTGLVNGEDYRVRVRAHNDSGWGPWSGWSVTATPEAPPVPPVPPNTFIDDDGSVFEADIEWLAAAGITRGCNPPANDRFCPDAPVTRDQMAAFLVRALDLPAGDAVDFVDDDGSVFESDIEALAAAGITLGCNPPRNDRFCPREPVTRGQMAAFLVRGLSLPAGGGVTFADDDGSVFESDIEALAAAGITLGCNPPTNDMFCPNSSVTRAQMAAFLHRALGA